MKNKSKLLEKVGLGTGIVGFAMGLGFTIPFAIKYRDGIFNFVEGVLK